MHCGDTMRKSINQDPKSQVNWCLKQKRGIKLEPPNENLCKVYIKKAKSALNMLSAANEREEIDWIATTAYYARYFGFYAVLQMCGIRSEIHECTLSLMYVLFVQEKILPEEYYAEFEQAKELRIDTQYYVANESQTKDLKKASQTAGRFVLKMEEIIENMNPQLIMELRIKLSNS